MVASATTRPARTSLLNSPVSPLVRDRKENGRKIDIKVENMWRLSRGK